MASRRQKLRMTETTGIFIFDKNQHFLVCHPTYSSGLCWSIPKGIPEKGETYEQAAIRELYEETNIKLTDKQIERIAFVGDYKYPDRDKELFAHVLMLEGDPVPTDLDCHSICKPKGMGRGREFPEVDNYFWMDISMSFMLNCSQKEALWQIIKNYQLTYNTKQFIGETE